MLKQLLPDKTNHQYNLRLRRHNLTLSVTIDARYFVVGVSCLQMFTLQSVVHVIIIIIIIIIIQEKINVAFSPK